MNRRAQRFQLLCFFLLSMPFSLFSQQLVVTNTVQNSGEYDDNVINFEVQQLNSLPENYRFFWHFGDGTYYDSSSGATGRSVQHTYPVNTGLVIYDDVYVEVTKLYDENDPPKRLTIGGSNKPLKINCTTCTNPVESIPSEPIDIETNRSIVSGDMITFILPYNISCEKRESFQNSSIYFEYDILEFDEEGFSPAPDAIVFNSTKKRCVWNLSSLQANSGQSNNSVYGNIFVKLIAKPDLTIGSNVHIIAGIDGMGDCPSGDKNIDGETVRNSHDPNGLTSTSGFVCPVDATPTIEYEIKFENFGDGPASTVIIKDIIPEIYDINSIQTIWPIYASNKVPPHTINGQEVQWILTGDWLSEKDGFLRGRAEPGFEIDFPEERTKGKLIFTIAYKGNSFIPEKCEAIVNQAEIIFDCNPPFYTNPHILDFPCADTTLCPSCERHTHMGSVAPIIVNSGDVINTAQIIAQLPLGLQDVLNNNYQSFRWYPNIEITDDAMLAPNITATRTMEYYLAAFNYDPVSPLDTCVKEIIKFPIQIDCDLGIDARIKCTIFGGMKIVAKATGNYSDQNALIWNNCSSGRCYVEKFENRLSQDSFLITLTDPLTNCSVYKKVEVKCNNSGLNIAGIIGIATSLIIITGLLLRRKK